ncbi:hypothetical protein P280DRAFT_427391 [Massarina eburnea CBS 473.64]|uniref:WW domain-containing protein n=1 Tax=Massarina eburnea CBS 473.64 TaxID=1395130 RepID=A0A6A6S0V5_9PLEO|nr:hypothetical protein P280DRAFT_427391 [Massarina eburnea CBS 473.64]
MANPPEGHTQQIPLCETDYFRRLDLLCHTCGEALRGSYITAIDNKFHVEHFTCSVPRCGLVFGPTDSYYEDEGACFCKRHYCQRAQKCHGCETPVLKKFVEIYRNGKNQNWHPECYMIHKYWNVVLKNEYGDIFTSGRIPYKNGVELSQDIVDEYLDRTEDLMNRIWMVLSAFEESCASSISDMLLHVSNAESNEAVKAEACILIKIEGFFGALDRLDRLKQAREGTHMTMQREQKLLCRKIVAFFAVVSKLTNDKPSIELSKDITSIVTGMAHYLKLLIRISLQTAKSMDPDNKEAVISGFLGSVETITENPMRSELQKLFRLKNYHQSSADTCSLCAKTVDTIYGQGLYWTYSQIYHIDCINCPSCNGTPRLSYNVEGKPMVVCSRCEYGSMMPFISQNFGTVFIILDSRSFVYTHLLYVAWARLLQILKFDETSSVLFLAESSTGNTRQETFKEGNTSSNNPSSGRAVSCPPGWKTYWSSPQRKYLYMNTKTGKSQWELPTADEESSGQSSSKELGTHTQAPSPDSDPNARTAASQSAANLDDYTRESLTLDDIPRLVSTQQSFRAPEELGQEDAEQALSSSTSAPPAPTSQLRSWYHTLDPVRPSHGHSQSLDRLPQIHLSEADGRTSYGITAPHMGVNERSTSFDDMGMPSEVQPVGKKKSSRIDKLDRWLKRKGAGFG